MQSFSPTDVFGRTSAYWMSQAERLIRKDDFRHAAALLRHVTEFEPQCEQARLRYADVLHYLGCHEMAIRELSSILSMNNECINAYGAIANNLYALGRRQEALDSFSVFIVGLHNNEQDLPMWDEEAYELEEQYYQKNKRHRARYHALIKAVDACLKANDCQGARDILLKCNKGCFPKNCVKRDLLTAQAYGMQNETDKAVAFAQNALSYTLKSCSTVICAALVFYRAGLPQKAFTLLSSAALLVRTASDEQGLCEAAHEMKHLSIARYVLLRTLKKVPYRLPTCYNLCLCLIRMGNYHSARYYIHLCRDMDSNDLPTERLFSIASGEIETEEQEAQVARELRSFDYYAVQYVKEQQIALGVVASSLRTNEKEYIQSLCDNEGQFKRCVTALSTQKEGAEAILLHLCSLLPAIRATRLLQELMLCSSSTSLVKRQAAAELLRLEKSPPFLIWQNTHLSVMNPTLEPVAEARLFNRLLVHKIIQAVRVSGTTRLVPYALECINRMTHKQRVGLAKDPARIWAHALSEHYAYVKQVPIKGAKIVPFGDDRVNAMLKALHLLGKNKRRR